MVLRLIALAAFLAVAKAYNELNVVEFLKQQGQKLRDALEGRISAHNLEDFIQILGHPACLVCATSDHKGPGSQPFRTLLLQETIKHGVIAPNLVISYAHGNVELTRTIDVFDRCFAIYRKALDQGIERYIEGRSIQPVYRKLNGNV